MQVIDFSSNLLKKGWGWGEERSKKNPFKSSLVQIQIRTSNNDETFSAGQHSRLFYKVSIIKKKLLEGKQEKDVIADEPALKAQVYYLDEKVLPLMCQQMIKINYIVN